MPFWHDAGEHTPMWLAVLFQFVATGVFGLLALLIGGPVAGLSGLLGGLCAAVPNALFAGRLALNKGRSPESYPVVFFLWEFIKVGLVIFLFGAVIAWEGDKHWLALIGGLIVALKMPLFAMWFGRSESGDIQHVGKISTVEARKDNHDGLRAAGIKS